MRARWELYSKDKDAPILSHLAEASEIQKWESHGGCPGYRQLTHPWRHQHMPNREKTYINVHTCVWTINEPHLPKTVNVHVILCGTCFRQYQASSAALGWPGDGDCYLCNTMCMHVRVRKEPVAWVRVCNSVKFETSQNSPPLLNSNMYCAAAHTCRHKPLLLSARDWVLYF